MKNRAFVIGSINQDIVARVDSHPEIGETVLGRDLAYYPGGKGANQAVACARLGGETSMLGNVGNDAAGKSLVDYLKRQGVDCSLVVTVDGQRTGTALITVNNNSENSIVVTPGANARWEGRPDSSDVFSENDIVMAQFEIPLDVVEHYFSRAKERGAETILNPSPIHDISDELLSLTDYLIVNEIELARISGAEIDPEDDQSVFLAAQKLKRRHAGALIVTLGDKGVRILEGDQWRRLSASRVKAMDTTGAGDCFAGAFAAALLAGKTILQAAGFGNRAAGISVTKAGAASSMPSLSQMDAISGP